MLDWSKSLGVFSVLLRAILSEQHLSTSGRVASAWPGKIVFSFDITHVESEVRFIRRLSPSHLMGLLPSLRT
jgi:hypothetical protein